MGQAEQAYHGIDGDLEGVWPVRVGDVVDLAVADGGLDRDPAVRGSQRDLVEAAALVGVLVDVQQVGPGQDQPRLGPVAGRQRLDGALLQDVVRGGGGCRR